MNIFDCNETKEMFMDDEAALADREGFVMWRIADEDFDSV